ncbi:hypothetical protein GCM10027612_56850 [Microbispora bryophytorum subsp. camponoti]
MPNGRPIRSPVDSLTGVLMWPPSPPTLLDATRRGVRSAYELARPLRTVDPPRARGRAGGARSVGPVAYSSGMTLAEERTVIGALSPPGPVTS